MLGARCLCTRVRERDRTVRGNSRAARVETGQRGPRGGGDGHGYKTAIRALLADFESREEFLEDVPVADTVMALQVLAEERKLEHRLASALLPTSD